MLRSLSIVLLILLSGPLSASLLDDAVQAYDAAKYADSIHLYEQAIEQGQLHGSVFYNLGNAYYRNGEKGKAVAAYLAARRLMPRDADVRANLRFVHEQGRDKLATHSSSFLRSLAFWVDYTAAREFFWFAVVLGSIGLTLLFLSMVFARLYLVRPWSLGMLALALVGCFLFFSDRYFERNWAAVSAPLAKVRSGPGVSNAVVFELHEAAPFVIEYREGEWYRIRLSDAKLGWIETKDVQAFSL